MKQCHWYKNPRYKDLLKEELVQVKWQFPQFKLRIAKKDTNFAYKGELYWQGFLRTNVGTTYEVFVVYPQTYPHSPLRVYVPEIAYTAAPHKYVGGRLCLIGEPKTALDAIAWASLWLNDFEYWKKTSKWL